ncbi:Tetraketide alpha-pyrone reductase 2 [Ancistrocladus abbreviatus]
MPEYCVTGGTGFIAAYLVKSLLEKGHTVRTTARDPEKVGFLWEMKGAKERLRIMKADLMVEGSFDEAINGVDGVFHTASPVLAYGENIHATLIDPCVKGTLNVLNACKKAASVRRVVLTSSCAAIRYRDDAHQVSPLNESHWSNPNYCKRNNLWYAYAKITAEKAAWEVAKESNLDLVVVNPSFVVGPLLTPQPTSTLLVVLGLTKGSFGEYRDQRIGFVHIEDVVSAHILAMEESKASGRLICSGPVAHWTEIMDMLKAKYPSYPFTNKCGSEKGENIQHSMDAGKIMQLGFPGFRSIPQMFDDCIRSFQEKGLL